LAGCLKIKSDGEEEGVPIQIVLQRHFKSLYTIVKSKQGVKKLIVLDDRVHVKHTKFRFKVQNISD
jgi:hypothetical protein